MDDFDPTANLGPDDPLQKWLQDPTSAEFVLQKAREHVKNTLGIDIPDNGKMNYTEPDVAPEGRNPYILNPSGTRSTAQDNQPPAINRIRAANIAAMPYAQGGDPMAGTGSGPGPGLPKVAATPFDPEPEVNPNPVAEGGVPSPQARPSEAPPRESSTDVSSKNKTKDKADAISDFAKTLGAIKPNPPPPVNPVGTPGVRSPNSIQGANLAQILSLMGAAGKPDPVATLGRLLVSGKA